MDLVKRQHGDGKLVVAPLLGDAAGELGGLRLDEAHVLRG
jgi:hypothetical protein